MPKKKELTEEEKKKLSEERKEEASRFTREREKLASKQGILSREAGRQLAAREEAGAAAIPSGQTGVAEVQARKQEVGEQLRRAGAFEQVTPREVSLEPRLDAAESIPVVGRSVAGLRAAVKKSSRFFKGEPAEEAFPALDIQTVRELALTEIKRRSFRKGITFSEAFGSFVEAIPVIGSLVSSYAGGLIEDPSSNAQNVLAEINKLKEAASTGQEKVRNGLEDPEFGLTRARSMEEGVAKLEGRIKLLIITSPILRSNTDQVNLIQEAILEAREKINRYRTASTFGLTAQLTGTGRVIPTDEQMFLELQRLQGG